jgi:uncharacterized membrane protein YgcG
MSHPFHPSELSGAVGDQPSSDELGETLAIARALETQLATGGVHASTDFVDRVMSAVAAEPRPQPAMAAGLAMRGGRIGSLAAALGDSWRVAFSGGRPLAVRAQAAAFVLVAIVALGSVGSIAAVGAVRLLTPAQTPSGPQQPNQIVAPAPTPTPRANNGLEATGTPEPTETAEPTDTPEPAATAEPARTPRPGKTAEPANTPEPNETDDPHETDDPGGSNGDGSGGDGRGGDGSGGAPGGGG